MQDLQRQLQAMQSLRASLVKFIADLNDLSGKYNASVNSLREAGLPVQVAEKYMDTYQQRNTSSLGNLIQMVENEDIPYVNRNIEALEDLISRTQTV